MHSSPDFRCPCEAIAMVVIVFSLLSMWVALGRGKWSIRAAISLTAIGLLVPIAAYQPIVFFSISGVTSVGCLSLTRLISNRYPIHRPKRRSLPLLWRKTEFWIGIIAGLATATATLIWATRTFWELGWIEKALLVVLPFSTVLIVSLMFGDRFRRGRSLMLVSEPDARSFHLIDAMVAILLLAVLFATNAFALRNQSIDSWRSTLIACGWMTLTNVSMAGLFIEMRLRWRLAFATLLVVMFGLLLRDGIPWGRWLTEASVVGFLPSLPWTAIVVMYASAFLMTTFCFAIAGGFRFHQIRWSEEPALRPVGITATAMVLGLFAAAIMPLYADMSQPTESPDFIAEDHLVYDELEAAMAPLRNFNPNEKTLAELRKSGKGAAADTILDHYLAIRTLGRELFRAPDAFSQDLQSNRLGQKLSAFRSWARCMDKEGKAALANSEILLANEFWIDCVHVGHGLSRGGELSYMLTGISIEGVGHEGLARLRKKLPVESIENLLLVLITIDGQRERLESIERRSDRSLERVFGWRYRLSMYASRHLSYQSHYKTQTIASPSLQATADAIARRDAAVRLLITEFAIQLFQAQRKRLPADLTELVPAFLPAVPIDPFTGQTIRYQTTDSGFIAYCAGVDGTDDGGQFGDQTSLLTNGFDFDLDTLTRPGNQNTPGMGGMGGFN